MITNWIWLQLGYDDMMFYEKKIIEKKTSPAAATGSLVKELGNPRRAGNFKCQQNTLGRKTDKINGWFHFFSQDVFSCQMIEL